MEAPLQDKRVVRFEEIILWPLRLRPSFSDRPVALKALPDYLEQALDRDGWRKLRFSYERPLFPDDSVARRQADHLRYASAVYFHDFVRRFLYAPTTAKGGAGGERFWIRPDIQSISFRLFIPGGKSAVEVTLAASVEAWLFEPDILIVVVRLSNYRDGFHRAMSLLPIDPVPYPALRAGHCGAAGRDCSVRSVFASRGNATGGAWQRRKTGSSTF
jgi:hypothetical protein